jgi:hypothetical protein
MFVEDKLVAASGTPPASRALTRSFEIDYEYRGALQRIGTLEVSASDAGPLRRTWERLGLVLVLNSLKAAIIAMLVLFLVRHMVTGPRVAHPCPHPQDGGRRPGRSPRAEGPLSVQRGRRDP